MESPLEVAPSTEGEAAACIGLAADGLTSINSAAAAPGRDLALTSRPQGEGMLASSASTKPLWRGVSHQVAAVVAPLVGIPLVVTAHSPRLALAAGVYALTLALMFSVSALYHRPNWPEGPRLWMRRLDHSAIFLLIAGTYTPVAAAVGGSKGTMLLLLAWVGAGAGALRALFWPKAPKPLVAGIYLVLGWAVVPFLGALAQALSVKALLLLVAGGLVYSLGAVVYATKRPNPNPRVFGYHEVFHLLVILASAFHYLAVLGVVSG